jgi:transcriptional regulator with XRE-family HTH domain
LAQICRALRRRLGITQRKLAELSGVPRDDLVLIEGGRAGEVEIERVRRVLESLDGRLRVTAWWNGAAADRLLDERHAGIIERATTTIVHCGLWEVLSEVTFSEYGERGSIDLLGAHLPTRSVLVGEVKASVGSLEETNRVFDVKGRLAPKIALARFGWTPSSVSRVLIFPEDRTVRRVIDRYAATMTALYPMRGREFRSWLRKPTAAVSAIWFLSEVGNGDRESAAGASAA